MRLASDPIAACIASCDIVGHGADTDHLRQIDRIRAINDLVRRPIEGFGNERVVWASGGDGGHVAFLDDALLPAVFELLGSLSDWSTQKEVPLRITVHRGEVSTIRGADGRFQLVGGGINLCGSLVNYGVPGTIVASAPFRDFACEERRRGTELPSFEFQNDRTIYLKHFTAHRLSLLSLSEGAEPDWTIERSDHRKLEEARGLGLLWQVIYHTKRLLQVDSDDRLARMALNNLRPAALRSRKDDGAHPLFGMISRDALRKVIEEAQLVERDDGDVICERGDSGDAMFIVLKGEVGAITSAGSSSERQGEPMDLRFTEGEIVGELALGLKRNRTATLQSVGPTVLLGINDRVLSRLLEEDSPRSRRLSLALATLLNRRILEHIYRNTEYLGLDLTDDERESDPEPWERLEDGTELIRYESHDAHGIAPGEKPELAEPGLYLLAGGQLVEKSESKGARKVLSGERFDILYVNLPRDLVSSHQHEFKIDSQGPASRITIVRISDDALTSFAEGHHYFALLEKLKRRISDQMLFDVFISYAFENADRAGDWKKRLESSGFSVYMSEPDPMHHFETEIDVALAESRVVMPLISRYALDSNWVRREIRKRQSIFPTTHDNILSVALEKECIDAFWKKFEEEGGQGVGIGSLTAGERNSDQEESAMVQAVDTLKRALGRASEGAG